MKKRFSTTTMSKWFGSLFRFDLVDHLHGLLRRWRSRRKPSSSRNVRPCLDCLGERITPAVRT